MISLIIEIRLFLGSWAIDMAEEFPHAEILGIDLVPANLGRCVNRARLKRDLTNSACARTAPPNVRFECDDVNLGLSHYKNQFDVVHMR